MVVGPLSDNQVAVFLGGARWPICLRLHNASGSVFCCDQSFYPKEGDGNENLF